MKPRTLAFLRRLADLPRVALDHVVGDVDARPSPEARREATVVVEHNVTVGPRLRQFTANDEPDDETDHLH